jgi:hypothetical protein
MPICLFAVRIQFFTVQPFLPAQTYLFGKYQVWHWVADRAIRRLVVVSSKI